MAKRKERRDPLEPVNDVPEVLAARAPAPPLTPSKPAAPAKPQPARDRSWDAGRSKATYDLPAALIERIKQIAEELGQGEALVKVSDVARLLIEAGLAEYEAGRLKAKPRPTKFKLFDD
jgi:hypothetical protein